MVLSFARIHRLHIPMSHSLMVNYIKYLCFFNKNKNGKPPSISRKYVINVFKRKKMYPTHSYKFYQKKTWWQADDLRHPDLCGFLSRTLWLVVAYIHVYIYIYMCYDKISKLLKPIRNSSIGHPTNKIPFLLPEKCNYSTWNDFKITIFFLHKIWCPRKTHTHTHR